MFDRDSEIACEFCARVDFVADTTTGLEGLGFEESETIMLQLMRRLSFDDLAIRVLHSDFPDLLFPRLLASYIASSDELLPTARRILEDPDNFSLEMIDKFSRHFWPKRIRESTDRNDGEHAWRILKIAALGSDALRESSIDYVLPIQVKDEPVGLLLPHDAVISLVSELYERFRAMDLVPDLLSYDAPRLNWGKNQHWPAGVHFAIAMGGCKRDETEKVTNLTTLGTQIFAIAESVGKSRIKQAA